MPAVAMIHRENLICPSCGAQLAAAGAQSIVTTKAGAVILFDDADPPLQLKLTLQCANGHELKPPPSAKYEVAGSSPNAPWALNAVAHGAILRSGKRLSFDKP